MKWKGIALLFLIVKLTSFSQPDVIKVVKEENNLLLFASLNEQIVEAKVNKSQVLKQGGLFVNDTIVIVSYWFTCFSGGHQHQRMESGDKFSSQIYTDINRLGKGGKAYFTDITGYSIFTHRLYKIQPLEIIITE